MLLSQIRYEQHHLQVLLRQDIPKEVSFESLNVSRFCCTERNSQPLEVAARKRSISDMKI